ncbi:MAG: hypothetical protein CME61_01575 [Halobacteriovoraceae bacterium]|nr:hypothetical protein [Halobacteriovoraceae bacterium]
MRVFNLLFILTFTSCSSYVDKLHQEMSQDLNKNKRSRTIQSYGQKGDQEQVEKRYTASDFEDNSPSSSLWTGQGQDSFFDTRGVRKEKGDIVTVLVMSDLKNRIKDELSRYFGTKTSNNDSVTSSPKEDDASKVYDKISSIVRKEIRSNHILLQGRKELIYEGGKHLIEVSSLINRKDVSPEDTVDSTKILQITIRVLR